MLVLSVSKESIYLFAADGILLVHFLFVAFVVLSLPLIFTGAALGWSWVRNRWFRIVHLFAISVVVLESWLGVMCPLTDWEKALRLEAGDAVYAGSFIAHWLDSLLFYRAAPWVFGLIYTLFGAAVLASWYWVRPRSFAPNRD